MPGSPLYRRSAISVAIATTVALQTYHRKKTLMCVFLYCPSASVILAIWKPTTPDNPLIARTCY